MTDGRPRVVVLQTCVPDYRVGFFETLDHSCEHLLVMAGVDYFAPSVVTAAQGKQWFLPVKNVFFARRSLLWQRGVLAVGIKAPVLVVEWNPRVLSTWVLLCLRLVLRRRSMVWGHARSQQRFWLVAQWLRTAMARVSSGIVAYTTSEAAFCRLENPGMPVWPAPNSSVRRSDILDRASIERGGEDVVYVGRLTCEKKVAILVRAWAKCLPTINRRSRLVLVGEGPERSALTALVAELGVAERVQMLGHISDPQRLEAIYRNALVAVSPGYVGLSAIQCMAYGTPMAISRSEPHSPEIESCRDGVNCRYFETDNIADLARVLISFFNEKSMWQDRSKQIASFIAENYTLEIMARGFSDAVAALCDNENGACRVALVWAQYGPYHQARLLAWRKAQRDFTVIGLELASKTHTYLWQRGENSGTIHALETVRPVEELGAFEVYCRAVRFFSAANVKVVFIPSYWPPTSLAVFLATLRVGAQPVMMNESHEHTGRAVGFKLALKKQLVRSFSAALIGGRPQRQYFRALGMRNDAIFEGYDAVDNEYYGVQADQCRANAVSVRLHYSLPLRYFLNIGRMEPKKNLHTLIKAYSIARAGINDFPVLVLVGTGQLDESLRSQCIVEGLSYADLTGAGKGNQSVETSADVLFYGFRQMSELPSFYGLATAFILPSLWEEWGLVVNEAMASQVPCVVSKVAGCAPDLVVPGETGLLFDATDAGDLAQCLLRISVDPDSAKEMGRRAREWIREWGLEKFAKNATQAARLAMDRRSA